MFLQILQNKLSLRNGINYLSYLYDSRDGKDKFRGEQ